MIDSRQEQRDAVDRKRKAEAEQRVSDMRWLMSHPQGRRFIWAWLSDLGLYRTPFAGETNKTNFNAGVHSAALTLNATILEAAPEEYDLMAREAREPARTVTTSKQG